MSTCRDAAVDDLIAYFLALATGGAGSPDDERVFRRRFDLMALQRNLKALGTFGYQTTTRGNPVYIAVRAAHPAHMSPDT